MSKEQIQAEQEQLVEIYGVGIVDALRKRAQRRRDEARSQVPRPLSQPPNPILTREKIPTLEELSQKLGREPTPKETATMEWMKPVTGIQRIFF